MWSIYYILRLFKCIWLGRCLTNFNMLHLNTWCRLNSCEIAHRWSYRTHLMTSWHWYMPGLSHCWSLFMSACSITNPQWINHKFFLKSNLNNKYTYTLILKMSLNIISHSNTWFISGRIQLKYFNFHHGKIGMTVTFKKSCVKDEGHSVTKSSNFSLFYFVIPCCRYRGYICLLIAVHFSLDLCFIHLSLLQWMIVYNDLFSVFTVYIRIPMWIRHQSWS